MKVRSKLADGELRLTSVKPFIIYVRALIGEATLAKRFRNESLIPSRLDAPIIKLSANRNGSVANLG
jgi:hypothetical protein